MLLPWRKLMAVDWLLAQPVDATQAQSDANDPNRTLGRGGLLS
jgi:hypothetical protein